MKNNKISFKDILKHQSKGKTLLSVIIVIFVVTVIVIYNVMLLRSVNENMVSIGRISAERSANTVDSFLSECITAVSVAESTLDEYIVSGKSEEEILDFMMQFDKSLVKTINQKTTKLYAYIGGNIYDGKGEIRKPDYVIDERPWYKKAMWNKGNFVLVDPYVDVHSGQMLMTISKTMSDGKSVIAFDISLEYIQEIVDNRSTEDSNITEIVLDSTATVVGHSDKAELGKNYRGEKDTLGAAIGERIDIDSETNFNISFGGHRYTVYIVPIQGRWCSVSVIATSDQYMPIRIMFLVSILASVVTIIILVVIMIRSGSRDMLASRLNFQLSSAADIYMSLSDIDLVNGTLIQIKDYNPDFVKHFDTGKRTVQDTFNNIMRGLPKSPTKQAAIDFVDLSTLDARLVEKNSVSLEYLSYENRWVRGRFVASERKPDGKLSHVLWMLEDISSEKRERDRLTEKAEKLTAQLSSAADIYISLCDLDIPNNSAVAIKNANPAIAKAVEDGKYHMQETFNGIMGGLPESPTKQLAIDFCDLSKIDEKLADANTMTVEYLSYGNIWVRGRYVVSERDENGKITHVLWMLENIDAEKRSRDKLSAVAERLNNQMSSMANIYMTAYDLDLTNDTFSEVRSTNRRVLDIVGENRANAQQTLYLVMQKLTDESDWPAVREFTDLSTLNERLGDLKTITIEYLSNDKKWRRARFIESERSADGELRHVLLVAEDIDKEKRARDKLTEKAEKLTAQLSSAADIYISLCDLDIPNNSAVAIKNANPAIAKAVEDGKDHMQETFNGIMGGLPESPTKQLAIDFCDLSKIDEKLADANTMTVEYLSYGNIWVRGRYVVSERDENGKITHVLWMLENIDAEKRARDKLTEKAEKLTAQLSSAADIYISLCDLDIPNNSAVAIKNANPAIAKAVEDGKDHMQETFNSIMGGLPESPTKQLAIDFCDLSKIDEKLADTNTMTVEYLSYGNIWVRGRYVVSERDENGKITHVLWMLENIDAEKRARDKLSHAAEKLNDQISSLANIYMTLYDFDLTNDTFSQVRKSTNRSVTNLVGESSGNAQKMLYMVMEKITDADTWPSMRDFWDLSTLDERLGDSKNITREYMSNEQTWRRARFIESNRAPDGTLRHVLLVAEDIDKERKDREKLIDMSERAVAANEAKSAFLSNMSHEIRTPINAVLGMNEMVLRESNDPAVISYSESIRTAGTTLLGLINDILDFSKIEAGKMEIIPVDYDLATVLSDLVNMIQTRLDAKGLMLITEFDSKIPHLLHGDEVRIKQIITNILTNAVKYTETGSVTFRVSYDRIEDDPDSILLKVSIKDTGIGIKPEDMTKLFSKFERIEEERNRSIEGTGLGMSITQSLLSMMDSKLDVESVYGEGSVFGFSLKQKVRKWDELGDYEKTYKNSVASRKKYHEKFIAPDAHVLVVDDTVMNLLVFTSLLKSTQIKIDTAEDGDRGIELSGKNKYDIIFLDHMMPNKDGIETLKEIRASADNPNLGTPMICLTANAISGAREKYIEAGFDDYLTKPIESAKLEEMIIEFLPKEKLIASALPDAPKKPKAVIPDRIFDITELDTIAGIKNAGSEELYLEMLKSYAGMMDGYLDKMVDYWLGGDVANALIKLHSLKGASRTVGAETIRRYAQRLEDAGNAGDLETLNSEMEDLLFRCRALGVQISSILNAHGDSDAKK